MKNALHQENRIKTADIIRKSLKKAFNEEFVQENVTAYNNSSLLIHFKSKSYLIKLEVNTS